MSFAGNKQNKKHLITQQSSFMSLRGSWADKQKTHPITHFQEIPVKPMQNIENKQTTLQYVNRQLQFECKSLRETLQAIQQKQSKQQSWRHRKLQESHLKIQEMSHKIQALTQQLTSKSNKITKIQQQLHRFQQSAQKYKTQAETLRKTNQNLQQELQTIKIKKNEQQQENTLLRSQLSQIRTQLAHQKCQNATYNQQHTTSLQKLQLQNDTLKNKIMKIEAQLTVKQSKTSSDYSILKQQYDRISLMMANKESDYSQRVKTMQKSWNSKMTEKTRELQDKYQQELEEYREQVRLIRGKYQDGRNQMQKDIKELEKIIGNLQCRVRELEAENIQYLGKIEGLQQTISIRNQEVNMMKEALRTRVENRVELKMDNWMDRQRREGSLQPSAKLKTETSSPNLTKRQCQIHKIEGCLRQRMERRPRRSLPHQSSHPIIRQTMPVATRQQQTINEAILRRCRLIIGEHYH